MKETEDEKMDVMAWKKQRNRNSSFSGLSWIVSYKRGGEGCVCLFPWSSNSISNLFSPSSPIILPLPSFLFRYIHALPLHLLCPPSPPPPPLFFLLILFLSFVSKLLVSNNLETIYRFFFFVI